MTTYRSDIKPVWCPGCGDYGVLAALERALAVLGRPSLPVTFLRTRNFRRRRALSTRLFAI